MSDLSNTPISDQYTSQAPASKPQPPKTPDIHFLRTYQRRYDSSHHHSQEIDYPNESVDVETSEGQKLTIQTYLLRVYPETFNTYNAYMDIPMRDISDIKKVISSRLGKSWDVIAGPIESPIRGYFRGDYTENNPSAWMFGLRLKQEQSI